MAPKRLLRELRGMDPYEFERFIAFLWECAGFDTYVTQEGRDRGVDVVATNDETGEKHLIQAKRYSSANKVGSEQIQQYASLYLQYPETTEVIVVTTGKFSKPALKTAAELDVGLVNGERLQNKIGEAYESARNSDVSKRSPPSDGETTTITSDTTTSRTNSTNIGDPESGTRVKLVIAIAVVLPFVGTWFFESVLGFRSGLLAFLVFDIAVLLLIFGVHLLRSAFGR